VRRIRAVVRGRVQGVGFRWAARQAAVRLGLVGQVRNLPTGEVETVAEGPAAAVARYVDWLRQGPPSARVTQVDVTDEPPSGSFTRFEVER
jgi:acylphosphatase